MIVREPTNEEQRLMIVGGFETLEEYLQWMSTPLDPEVLDKLEQDTVDAELEEELMEEMRREAEGEEPLEDDWEEEYEQDEAPLERAEE